MGKASCDECALVSTDVAAMASEERSGVEEEKDETECLPASGMEEPF